MVLLIIYAIGFSITMVCTFAAAAQRGSEKDDFAAAMIASALWPLAWLYAIGVGIGKAVK